MFVKNQFYHVYNQGNNRRKLFFSDADYKLFLFKLRSYIKPFATVTAYCIMPNHYHLFLFVRNVSKNRSEFKREVELFQKQYMLERKMIGRLKPIRINEKSPHDMTLHDSIAIVQRSYTRAINLKKGWTGSMFRTKFKVNDGWKDMFVGVENMKFFNDLDFVGKCIDYIHQNPVKSHLCARPEDWKYSSARDYMDSKGFNISDERNLISVL